MAGGKFRDREETVHLQHHGLQASRSSVSRSLAPRLDKLGFEGTEVGVSFDGKPFQLVGAGTAEALLLIDVLVCLVYLIERCCQLWSFQSQIVSK